MKQNASLDDDPYPQSSDTLEMLPETHPAVRLFYFLRHGETDWNRQGIYQGPHDIPLNESGRVQAAAAAKICSKLKIDSVFTSPLVRASHTAKMISDSNGGLPLVVMPEFIECKSERSARFVLRRKGVKKLPSFEKLAGFEESVEQFLDRVESGLMKLLFQSCHEYPLVVAHGGTCTGICELLGVKPIRSPNCQLIKFEMDTKGIWQTEYVD